MLAGDYNLNNSVDAADYVAWRKMQGQTVPAYTGADGDGSGVIGSGDYGLWAANFGQTGPPQPIIRFAPFAADGGLRFVLEIIGSGTLDTVTVSSNPLDDIEIHYQNALGADLTRTFTEADVIAAETASGLAFRGLYVRGLEADDTIDLTGVTSLSDITAIVDAGDGADDVTGGGGADLILGGRGSDTLAGGGGQDLVVGGRDGDVIDGEGSPDIIIGGEPTAGLAALDEALALWNAPDLYNQRVTDVSQVLVANQTVIEDQTIDTLTGGPGRDLFYAAADTPSNNDVVADLDTGQEQVEVTHPPIPASQLVSEAVGAVLEINDGSIDYVRFIFDPALWSGSTRDAVTLQITLVELRISGDDVHLQTLTLLLSAATLVSLNGGPGGTAVVDIDTTTEEINAGSRLEVTTTLRGPGVLDGLPESFTTAVVLDPVQPS